MPNTLTRTVRRVRRSLARLAANSQSIALALFALAGTACVSYGVWRIHPEAGIITLGVLFLYAGWDLSRE